MHPISLRTLGNGVWGRAYRLSTSMSALLQPRAWVTLEPWGRQAQRGMLNGEFLLRILGEERAGGDRGSGEP